MRRRRVRPILWWVLVAVGMATGLQCFWLVVGPRVQSWRMEKALARFQASPSQARADEVVELLGIHAADAKQGRRVLRLLLQPNVAMRRTYAVGEPVGLNLERAFDLGFRDVL